MKGSRMNAEKCSAEATFAVGNVSAGCIKVSAWHPITHLFSRKTSKNFVF